MLTSIDNLEQEVAELQSQLRSSIPSLVLLTEIPEQLAQLAAECTALNAASVAATVEARSQAEQLAAGRTALEDRVTQWKQAAEAREIAQKAEIAAASANLEDRITQWQQEAGERHSAHVTQMVEQWNTFRSAAEAEQNQVMRIAMTTRQELTDRIAAQEKLVASLDERLAKMNDSLANLVTDLRDTRREQRWLALLVAVIALVALAVSAGAVWAVFFSA